MNEERYICSPKSLVNQGMREQKNEHRGAVFWFTGLSGAGKSTIAHVLEKIFFNAGKQVIVLDGDIIRHGLCSDLSFSPEGRAENMRRIAELAHIFAKQGFICLCAFISPLKAHREIARSIVQQAFYEIYISCSLEECEKRDVKGYYKLARDGKIKNYTGISAPYETPENADLTVYSDKEALDICVKNVHEFIAKRVSLKDE